MLAAGVGDAAETVVGEDHDVVHQVLDLSLHRFAPRDVADDESFVKEAHDLCDDLFLQGSLTCHNGRVCEERHSSYRAKIWIMGLAYPLLLLALLRELRVEARQLNMQDHCKHSEDEYRDGGYELHPLNGEA